MSLLNKEYSSESDQHTDDMTGGAPRSKSIFEHLFVIDAPYKADLLNVLQYSFVSLIPLVLLNKLIQYAIPEASPSGGSVELVMEIIGQISMLIIGLILIHRFTTYFGTYSGEPYPQHSIICFVLGLLIVLISIQSKLGEKINILVERVSSKWNGTPPPHEVRKHKRHSKNHMHSAPDVQVMERASNPYQTDTTHISNLPVMPPQMNNNPVQNNISKEQTYGQSAQAYSLAYDIPSSGGAMRQDGDTMMNEPTAANGVLGGSFGSVW